MRINRRSVRSELFILLSRTFLLFVFSLPFLEYSPANSSALYAQQNPNSKQSIYKITFQDTLINTGDKFIIQSSDILKIENITLDPLSDYRFDYRNGIIHLEDGLFKKYSLDTMRIYNLNAEYDLFPFNFREEYSNFDIKLERDTLTGDTVRIAVQSRDIVENLFEGTNLEKSGSLFRGFTLGTNRDISLNSGFRLQLNGKLSKDIDIIAALSDENTPIQPEGNTQKLQELDKVFIEIKSKNLGATIGDIDVNIVNSEFVKFNRKIQGAKGFGDFGFGNFLLTGAVSRGKFNSNNINGSDGVQGPYRLTGVDNEINIIILSGTEKVFIDGVLMARGEQADYTIDYGLGQITFMNKRLITNASRIVVDFEYTDRKYSRTLIAANNKYDLFNKKLSLTLSYINESDNEDKTIDFTLSDSDRVILSNAGDDKQKAVKSGVTFVGRDSLNRPLGAYIKVDTLINLQNYTFYRFSPGSDSALYNVTFSYVGQGNGDYTSQSSLQYSFAGIGQGSYSPVVYLPLPSGYQIASVSVDYAADKNKDLFFKFESAYSFFDKNKFSSMDNNRGGVAFNGEIGYRKSAFNFIGIRMDNFAVNYKERIINKTFNSLDRINTVEFYRNFDLSDSASATENYREGSLIISPGKLLRIAGNFAQLIRGDFFNSVRTTGTAEFNYTVNEKSKNLPRIKYSFEKIGSSNTSQNIDGQWIKQNAFAGWKKFLGPETSQKFFELIFEFTGENRRSSVKGISGDSLQAESFSFNEFSQKALINNILDLSMFAEINYRKDDNVNRGNFFNLSNMFTQRYSLSYNGVSWFMANADLSIRDRVYSDEGKQLNNADNKTVLVNSRMRIAPLNSAVLTDLLYSVTSERTAKTQKLFVLVPKGQGNYIYLGDINANGIQDENEFQLVNYDGDYIKLNLPTDQFFPTVDLRTSARVTLKPSKYFFSSPGGGLLSVISDAYNNLSTETYFRIDEKSKDPDTDNLYYLKLNTFLNDSNTLAGSQLIQQDVNLFENNPMYSFRFRFIQLRGLNQYSGGNERYLNIQRSYRIKLGLTADITSQVELIMKTDRNIAPVTSVRNRNISSYNVNSDVTYRPVPKIESGFQLNFTQATDIYPVKSTLASINQEILRFVYSFASMGRIRAEIERDEVILSTDVSSFPYELTNGRPSGKSYYWRLFLDYNISKNIQANINYDGRVEGARQVIHTGRAQVTAFF